MEGCIFCKIADGSVPSSAVFEDARIKAFQDKSPKAPTHILVIPKEHVTSIADLRESDRSLVSEIIYAAKKIAEDEKLTGYKIVFNVGADGGQSVDHLHLHLLGGWPKGEPDNAVLLKL